MKTVSSLLFLLLLVSLACFSAPPAVAQGLSFNALAPYETTPGTFIFAGTITNDTGVSLQSSDLFFDFTGFDPGEVDVNQLLGATDFTIGTGTTSSVNDLFDARLSPGAADQAYPVTVQLQDVNGNVSDPVTVRAGTAVPEMGTLALLVAGCIGLAPLALLARRG